MKYFSLILSPFRLRHRAAGTKRGPLACGPILAGAALMAMACSATAQTYTWSGISNSDWNTTSNNWNGFSAWSNGSTSDAVFDIGFRQTTTLAADITANNLSFAANGYSIAGGGFSLTLAGSNSGINVASGIAANLGMNITDSGAVGLTKTGAGTLTLSGLSTYTGPTTLNGGVLSVQTVADGGVDSPIGKGTGLVFGGGTLHYTNASTNGSTNRSVTLNASGGTIDVVGSDRYFYLTGTLSGTGGLIKTGAGILSLSGNHSGFTGPVTVNAGRIYLSNLNPSWVDTAFTLNAGASILLLSPASGSNVNYTLGSLTGAGYLAGAASTNVTNTYSVGADGTSTTFSGSFGFQGTGIAAFTKVGAGTLTLAGATPNGYNGLTTVSEGVLALKKSGGTTAIPRDLLLTGGTLRLDAANQIANDSAVTLDGGTFSTGTTIGFSETAGILSVTADSMIEFGTGVHTLQFAGLDEASTGRLSISGWTGSAGGTGTGGQLLFELSYPSAAAANTAYAPFLSGVQFSGFETGGAFFESGTAGTYQLAPVPEPGTAFGAGMAALGIALRRRRTTNSGG